MSRRRMTDTLRLRPTTRRILDVLADRARQTWAGQSYRHGKSVSLTRPVRACQNGRQGGEWEGGVLLPCRLDAFPSTKGKPLVATARRMARRRGFSWRLAVLTPSPSTDLHKGKAASRGCFPFVEMEGRTKTARRQGVAFFPPVLAAVLVSPGSIHSQWSASFFR